MKPYAMVGPVLVVGGFALTAVLYPRLPDMMPVHFDSHDAADQFVAKPLGPFVGPVMALITFVITSMAVRRVSGRAREILPIAMAAFGLFMVVATLRAALGEISELSRILVIGTGLLVVVTGNYLGKSRPNRWVGIRTPWTLGDEEVWRRTHRIGGILLVISGLLAVIAAIVGAPYEIAIAPIAVAAIVAVGYSYAVYRRLRAAPRE